MLNLLHSRHNELESNVSNKNKKISNIKEILRRTRLTLSRTHVCMYDAAEIIC